MASAKMSINGNDYVGAFAVATDSYALIAERIGARYEHVIEEVLRKKIARVSINGSDLIGIYVAANSHALLLPELAYRNEADLAARQLDDVNVAVLETGLNALRNNILANDKIAIINPMYSSSEAKIIGDNMGVEVIRMGIGGFSTVGANNILTNKGMVMNNRVSGEEEEALRKLVSSVSQSTANMGSLSIGLCTIANSEGIIAGSSTSGYEIANMEDGLGL